MAIKTAQCMKSSQGKAAKLIITKSF